MVPARVCGNSAIQLLGWQVNRSLAGRDDGGSESGIGRATPMPYWRTIPAVRVSDAPALGLCTIPAHWETYCSAEPKHRVDKNMVPLARSTARGTHRTCCEEGLLTVEMGRVPGSVWRLGETERIWSNRDSRRFWSAGTNRLVAPGQAGARECLQASAGGLGSASSAVPAVGAEPGVPAAGPRGAMAADLELRMGRGSSENALRGERAAAYGLVVRAGLTARVGSRSFLNTPWFGNLTRDAAGSETSARAMAS